jgi:hypothetical protein
MQFEALPTFHIPKARIEGLGSFLGGFKLTGEESGRGRAWRRVGIAKPLVEFTPERNAGILQWLQAEGHAYLLSAHVQGH